tara:strand:+ start:1632 stop:1763 length:132 start_codon:yes stop_codon:yes gene_type:complete
MASENRWTFKATSKKAFGIGITLSEKPERMTTIEIFSYLKNTN